jgi:hypothetical protein
LRRSLACASLEQKVSTETMDFWLTSNVTGNLIDVPGIDFEAVEKLNTAEDEYDRITDTHQLLGKYLQLHGPGKISLSQLNKKFEYFLEAKGIYSHRSIIVFAVAQKVLAFFPGFHEGEDDEYDHESNGESDYESNGESDYESNGESDEE